MTPGLWIGLLFAAGFVIAAVQLRRYRGPIWSYERWCHHASLFCRGSWQLPSDGKAFPYSAARGNHL